VGLDLAPAPALVILELAPSGVECLSDRDVDVLFRRLQLDDDLFSRHRQANANSVQISLAVMAVWRLDPDLALQNVIGETREAIGPLQDLGFDRIGPRHLE
jgi:hypothetical protein